MKRTRRRWVGPLVLALLAVVLGTVGSLMTGQAPGDSSAFTHALYNAVRCFSLNGPAEGNLAWPLDLGRFLAPLATVWAALEAFAAATAERRRERRVLAGVGHTLVCGLGREGLALALEARGAGEEVVAVERAADGPGAAQARAHGVVVLAGDATQPDSLVSAGVARATRVIATLPLDRENLAVALAAAEGARARASALAPLVVHARCDDEALEAAAQRRRLLNGPGQRGRLAIFGRERAAARQLVTDHLAEPLARAAAAGRVPHVVLVGSGQVGRHALRRLLEAPVRASTPFVHVTLAAREAHARLAPLRACVAGGPAPALETLAELDAFECDLTSADALGALLAQVHARRPVDAAVLCLDEPELAAACALAARTGAPLPAPLFVRLREAAGLEPLLLPDATGPARPPVVPFGLDRDLVRRSVVVEGVLERLAHLAHAGYLARGGAGAAWEELDPDLARSSVAQADHVPLKLAAVGRRARRSVHGETIGPLAPEATETLARLEHLRWCAERLLAGWRRAPGPKDAAARTHPDLVPWEALTEPVRELDRDAVRRLPELLANAGLSHEPWAP